MTHTSNNTLESSKNKNQNVWVELGPVLAFIVLYNVLLRLPEDPNSYFTPDYAIYWATGILIVSTLGIVANRLFRKQKIPAFLIVSSLVVGVFGIIGIVFQSKLILYIKPTITNVLYAAIILGGLVVKRNVWKLLFGNMVELPDFAWRTLAIRWALFFLAMAVWNEVLWRNFSEEVWVNFKLGNIVIVLLFTFANAPYTLKHMRKT